MIPALTGILAPHGLATSFESIATVTVGAGGSASVSFSSIPQTYQHLQVRWIAATNRATYNDNMIIRYNNDSGSNYMTHTLYGDGSNAYAEVNNGWGSTPQTVFMTDQTVGSSGVNSSMFGAGVLDILDYTSTNKYRVSRLLNGLNTNATADGSGSYGRLNFTSNLYLSTTALSRIDFSPAGGTLFLQYTQIALYGVK